MAQIQRIELIDDIDGSVASQTVSFALDSKTYDIDLSSENAEKLRAALLPWITAARRSGGGRKPRGTAKPQRSNPRNATIRTWAQNNGYSVSDRGRIPQPIVEAYEAANPGK